MRQGINALGGGGGRRGEDNFPTFHFKYLLKPRLSFSALTRDELQESHIPKTIKQLVHVICLFTPS